MSLIKVRIPAKAADAGNFKVGDLVRMNEGGLTGKITKIEPNGHFRVSFLYNRANGFSQSFSANEIVMVKPAKDSAADSAAQDAGVPSDLAFAVGAIENAIEKYSKTFSRYEDNLEEKDFKRYNAIFHAAVNMHRAIQSA